MQKKANVILCCDADQDRGQSKSIGPEEFSWKGISNGIPALIDAVSDIENTHRIKVQFNWFFRSDLQMEKVYRNPAWPYESLRRVLDRVARRGDEIGWHPHFWRLHDDGTSWFQETDDLGYIGLCLKKGFNAIPSDLRPRTVRTGWDFHNAFTMGSLSALGLVADLSALPGVSDVGRFDSKTGERIGVRDWDGVPDRPYVPSRGNYKLEAKNPAERLEIVEIPVSTYRLPSSMQLVKGVRNKLRGIKARTVLSEPYLTKSGKLLKAAVNYHLARRDAVNVPFVVEFHADELLRDSGSYSLRNALKNISLLIDSYRKAGMHPSFSRAGDVALELREKWRK